MGGGYNMDPITIGLIASGIGALGGGLLNFFGSKKQANTNENIANKNVRLQQYENELAREREDNAVQRRALDLERAGLSKTLAAGSAASSQLMTAPKNEFQAPNLGEAALQGISQGVQVAQNVANVQNTIAQTKAQQLANDTYLEKHYADLDYKKAQTRLAHAQASVEEIVGANKQREIDSIIDARIEGILKSYSDRLVNDSVIDVNAQKIAESKSVVSFNNYKMRQLVFDVAYQKLKIKAEEHNLAVARNLGLPVGSTPSGLFGGAISGGIALGNIARIATGRGSWIGY